MMPNRSRVVIRHRGLFLSTDRAASATTKGRVEQSRRGVELFVRGQIDPGATIASIASSTSAESTVSAAASCELQVIQGPRTDDRAGHRRMGGDESQRQLDQRQAGIGGDLGQLLDRVELGPVRRNRVSKRRGMTAERFGALSWPCRIAPGQPAGSQRAPHQHAEPVLLRHRQHMTLDAALQDRVAGLLGNISAQVVRPGGPLGLHDPISRVGRRAEVADLCRRAAGRSARTVSPRRWCVGSQRCTW